MKRTLTFSNFRLGMEILLVAALVVAVFSRGLATRAESPQAPDTLYWYVCNGPNNNIAVLTDRVHIFCDSTSPVAGAPALSSQIHWFAVPTSPDSMAASRFMSLLQTAVITGNPIWVQADPADMSGASFGCGASDCRKMYGLEMR